MLRAKKISICPMAEDKVFPRRQSNDRFSKQLSRKAFARRSYHTYAAFKSDLSTKYPAISSNITRIKATRKNLLERIVRGGKTSICKITYVDDVKKIWLYSQDKISTQRQHEEIVEMFVIDKIDNKVKTVVEKPGGDLLDPLAAARVRGRQFKHELLYGDGQPLTEEDVATLLKISNQEIARLRSECKILAISQDKQIYLYPHWQFKDGDILIGFDRVLAALANFDPLMQLMFLKTGDLRLNGNTPLECLISGDIDAVVNAATCYGEPNPA